MSSTPTFLATASLVTFYLTVLSLPVPALAEGCEPRAVRNETRFPLRAQLRGHRGTVYVKVRVDEKGRPIGTSLHRSSGHRLLDRAAEQSVRKNWVFDVSNCSSADLQEDRLVAVEYRNDEYGPSGKVARNSTKNSLDVIPKQASRK